jgi:hypothetical protein
MNEIGEFLFLLFAGAIVITCITAVLLVIIGFWSMLLT